MEIASIIISCIALIISGLTAWLTLLRKGSVRMTQPTTIFFGPDEPGLPKIYFRALLYSTAKRGQIIQALYVKVRRGESVQTFNLWVLGNEELARGSGLFVGEEGVSCNHHFFMPRDGTHYEFLPGDYIIEVYASLVGSKKTLTLSKTHLSLNETHITAMRDRDAGIFFDWGPDSLCYHAHIDARHDSRQKREDFS